MGWTDLYSPLVPSRGGGTRRRPDLRGPAAALAKVAAAVVDEAEVAEFVEMAVAVLVEVAAVMDEAEEAPGAEARRRLDLSGAAAVLAEVAVANERRHSWKAGGGGRGGEAALVDARRWWSRASGGAHGGGGGRGRGRGGGAQGGGGGGEGRAEVAAGVDEAATLVGARRSSRRWWMAR
ncbi:hypothetical protein OsJ_14221 [Oryza sativa Japonica Group]|uniref:Uncharacterized protein n=1 Tax=Oryza sativa subsp. japonica TaxID=39947 RepID=A3AS75_ORYSJ|nr:hypothetical protein OsJ_14221 [Oryza sativa Japonica Group]